MSNFEDIYLYENNAISDINNKQTSLDELRQGQIFSQRNPVHFERGESISQEEGYQESEDLYKTIKTEEKSVDMNIFEPWKL